MESNTNFIEILVLYFGNTSGEMLLMGAGRRMIRLLIVDDERTIRNGLVRHIDWQTLGVDMVTSAANAQAALHICEKIPPDIVLSDIRMGDMSGVDMCKQIHVRYPECKIIFVSGYAEKEYLKAAISLGVVDFLEKPVQLPLIHAAVQKAVRACEEQRRKAVSDDTVAQSRGMLGQIVLRALAHNDYPDNFHRYLKLLGLFSKNYDQYRFCMLHGERLIANTGAVQQKLQTYLNELSPVSDQCARYGAFVDDRNYLILLCGTLENVNDSCSFLQALRENMRSLCIDGTRFFLTYGSCQENKMNLYHSYNDCVRGLRDLFFKGWGHYAEGGTNRPFLPLEIDKKMTRSFTENFLRQDGPKVEQTLDQIRGDMSFKVEANPEQIRNLYCSLVYMMKAENSRRMASANEESVAIADWIGQMQRLETIEALDSFVRDVAREILSQWQADDKNGSAVQKAIRIMRENYGDPNLSVASLAENVYLTPPYLSGLFKKHTGKTIGQYLTDIRIEQSLKLLMDKQLKLYQIAEQVGYEDPNYFARIFKRHMGMTPSEYREKLP